MSSLFQLLSFVSRSGCLVATSSSAAPSSHRELLQATVLASPTSYLTSQQASAAFLPFHVSATSLPPSSFPLLPHERCQHDSHKAGKQNRMAALKSYHRYDN